MDQEPNQELIDKYLKATASESELADLHRWYTEKSQAGAEWAMESPGEYSELEKRVFERICNHTNSEQSSNKRQIISPLVWRIAAAVLLFAVASVTYYFAVVHDSGHSNKFAVIQVPQKSLSNRYVLLPDSSIVILRAGSQIKYTYSKNLRTVYLIGEAYFDVRHHQDRPFIVYSGTSKTTVLGTAFNIKAFTGQAITVTVSRGKVSVENGKQKSLAVLKPNQQLSFQNGNINSTTVAASAVQVIDWTRSDMQFEKITFKELTHRLSERYSQTIDFANIELEKCLITGRFTGTETVEEVLQVISETMGTSYKIKNNIIYISGNACL